MGRQLELIDESGKIHKVNVQDVKVTYPFNELIKCLPDNKAFGCAATYHAHPKHIGPAWSLNSNVLPDTQDWNAGSSSSTTNNDQITHNMSVLEQISYYVCLNVTQTTPIPIISIHGRPWLPINN